MVSGERRLMEGGKILNVDSSEKLATMGQDDHIMGLDQGKDQGTSDVIKDGDPWAMQSVLGKNEVIAPKIRDIGGVLGSLGCWKNLFGVKTSCKSSFPKIKDISNKEQGTYALEFPSRLIDHNILSMVATLVGKFVGPRPNIDIVRTLLKTSGI